MLEVRGGELTGTQGAQVIAALGGVGLAALVRRVAHVVTVVPAESTSMWSSRAALSLARITASAVGLRQMLPMQKKDAHHLP